MNRFVVGLLAAVAVAGWVLAYAMPAALAWERLPAPGLAIAVDWQEPQALPRRFRNHCTTDVYTSRPYCADHCGAGYQFFYCSRQSFGCCRLGFGYCDWNGVLRCHP